jgi:pimeloyl-ACP methyl ester carboxylesterase
MGKKDILIPPSNGELIAEKTPNAEIIYFDENAHFIHTEEPDKFLEVVLRFLM